MKKILALLLAALLVFGMCACGGETAQQSSEPSTEVIEPEKPGLPKNPETLKVLVLGHSLAVDANHMLALVAAAEGYAGLTVGTLYYSGCPLYKHVEFLTGDMPEYNLYLSNSANPKPPEVLMDVTMYQALRHDKWDVIIIQAGVFEIAEDATYKADHLQTIIDYCNKNKYNKDAVFGWNMTWVPPVDRELMAMYPYTPNSYETGYLAYGYDRATMYNNVTKCVADNILTNDTFVCMIPSGTVMENALSSYMTEKDIHRDYAHASDFGRVATAYAWYCTLLGIDKLEEIKLDAIPVKYFRSLTGLQDYTFTQAEKDLIVESVNNALANPLQMTQSQYTEAPADYVAK